MVVYSVRGHKKPKTDVPALKLPVGMAGLGSRDKEYIFFGVQTYFIGVKLEVKVWCWYRAYVIKRSMERKVFTFWPWHLAILRVRPRTTFFQNRVPIGTTTGLGV